MNKFTKIDGNSASYSLNRIKANARIRTEQNVHVALKNLKLKILGQLFDEVLLRTDSCFKQYKANEDHLTLMPCSSRSTTEKLVTSNITKCPCRKNLWMKCRNLHGEFGGHLVITKILTAYPKKSYFPNKARLIRRWVTSCELWVREKRIDNRITHHICLPNAYPTRPEDAMQIENPYPTCRRRHQNGNRIMKSPSNMMMCTPEHGSQFLESLFLTTIKTNWTYLTLVK